MMGTQRKQKSRRTTKATQSRTRSSQNLFWKMRPSSVRARLAYQNRSFTPGFPAQVHAGQTHSEMIPHVPQTGFPELRVFLTQRAIFISRTENRETGPSFKIPSVRQGAKGSAKAGWSCGRNSFSRVLHGTPTKKSAHFEIHSAGYSRNSHHIDP